MKTCIKACIWWVSRVIIKSSSIHLTINFNCYDYAQRSAIYRCWSWSQLYQQMKCWITSISSMFAWHVFLQPASPWLPVWMGPRLPVLGRWWLTPAQHFILMLLSGLLHQAFQVLLSSRMTLSLKELLKTFTLLLQAESLMALEHQI